VEKCLVKLKLKLVLVASVCLYISAVTCRHVTYS